MSQGIPSMNYVSIVHSEKEVRLVRDVHLAAGYLNQAEGGLLGVGVAHDGLTLVVGQEALYGHGNWASVVHLQCSLVVMAVSQNASWLFALFRSIWSRLTCCFRKRWMMFCSKVERCLFCFFVCRLFLCSFSSCLSQIKLKSFLSWKRWKQQNYFKILIRSFISNLSINICLPKIRLQSDDLILFRWLLLPFLVVNCWPWCNKEIDKKFHS